ncbi:MAG: hypothetical protein HC771_03830 [Synechococcales cyanobacterium CRU_2_2]|nr:hypothetical protein [Synechococcales cyanobacterium CRU_2_2]
MRNHSGAGDRTNSTLQSIVGVAGLILVLGAGVYIPLKVAEVFFGYSVSEAFWNLSDVKKTDQKGKYQ